MIINCKDGFTFYTRIGKSVGNQFWSIVSYNDDHTCHKIAHNRQKIE